MCFLKKKIADYKNEERFCSPYYQDREEGEELPPAPESTWQTKGRGKEYCIHQTGSDDKESRARLISPCSKNNMVKQTWKEPDVSKVARLYTADLPEKTTMKDTNCAEVLQQNRLLS